MTRAAEGRRLTLVAGMASYLDSGALVASGLAIGGFYVGPLGLGGLAVGVLLGLQTVSFAAGAIAGGRLSDRWGRRTVLLSSLAVFSIGIALLAWAGGIVALAVGAVLTGAAIGADLPSSLALISEEAPAGRRGRVIVVSQLLWVLGIGTTGLLAYVLADYGVLAGRLLYVHLLVVSVVVLGLRLNLRESEEWQRATKSASEPPTLAPGPPARGRDVVRSHALAIGAYYTLWNLGANTVGQFRPFVWINVMGGSEQGASALILLGIPLSVVGGLAFLRMVDTGRRQVAIACGSLASAAGWLAVAMFPSPVAFIVLVVCFLAGAAFSGEAAYKVWSQELIPTLQRASVQGLTMAVARVAAACFALLTPSLAISSPHVLFGTLLLAHLGATALAIWWIPRLG